MAQFVAYDALVKSLLRRMVAPAAEAVQFFRLGPHPHPDTASVDDAPTGASVRPEAEPYFAGDGPVGVLLCHGFTGSPHSLRAWAESLHAAGFRVALPRLPGHGTTWQEMNETTWTDWYSTVEREFLVLRESCEQVFICGLSMGGGLTLRLAEQFGDQVAGLVVVNPAVTSNDKRLYALPVLHRVVASLPGIANDIAMPGVVEGGYDRNPLRALSSMTKMWVDIRANLSQITQPILLFRSVNDHVVDPSSARLILAEISSTDVTERVLERSFHVATMDYEAEQIFSESADFFRRLRQD